MTNNDNYNLVDIVAEDLVDQLLSKRALDVTIMDVSQVTSIADRFVTATANSDVHMRTLIGVVTDQLDKLNIKYRIEGEHSTQWALVDCSDIIVHVFSTKAREYYNLDRVWGDVPIRRFENVD